MAFERQRIEQQIQRLQDQFGRLSRSQRTTIGRFIQNQIEDLQEELFELDSVDGNQISPEPLQEARRGGRGRRVSEQEIEARAQQIAEQLLEERVNALRLADNGKVFSQFERATDIVENQKQIATEGIWTGKIGTLNTFHTSSTQTDSQQKYYYEIFDDGPLDETKEPQFSVAYGHRAGSGSSAEGTLNDSPTRAIYSQYRLLLLEPDDTTFTFANNTNSDSCYFINFNRVRIKEKLDPGNWQLHLHELNGGDFLSTEFTGSNVQPSSSLRVYSLIDDSGDAQQNISVAGGLGDVYNVVSGSIETGIHKDGQGNPVYYGLVYPNQGIVVLNGDTLDSNLSFNTSQDTDINGNNAEKLFISISGSAAGDPSGDSGFIARNAETVTSTHYFVRVKNSEYNFSNNPTFVTGSVGEFKQPTFIGDPKVYITTVGLYNDRQELLAVAKLSKPIIKSFTTEAVIKVKLNW